MPSATACRHELLRVPDALMRRPDDPLSHLRLGRGVRDVTGTRSDATSRALRMMVTNSGAKAVVVWGILGVLGIARTV